MNVILIGAILEVILLMLIALGVLRILKNQHRAYQGQIRHERFMEHALTTTCCPYEKVAVSISGLVTRVENVENLLKSGAKSPEQLAREEQELKDTEAARTLKILNRERTRPPC